MAEGKADNAADFWIDMDDASVAVSPASLVDQPVLLLLDGIGQLERSLLDGFSYPV